MRTIDKKDLESRLCFLFRLQHTISSKNRGEMEDEKLENILSSIVFNGIMLLYQTRYPDAIEIMSPAQFDGVDRWAKIAEPFFNKCEQNIHRIEQEYPGLLSINKVQIEIIVNMEGLAETLIQDETNSNEQDLPIPGGQDDEPEIVGPDVPGDITPG